MARRGGGPEAKGLSAGTNPVRIRPEGVRYWTVFSGSDTKAFRSQYVGPANASKQNSDRPSESAAVLKENTTECGPMRKRQFVEESEGEEYLHKETWRVVKR